LIGFDEKKLAPGNIRSHDGKYKHLIGIASEYDKYMMSLKFSEEKNALEVVIVYLRYKI
jgi:hypothetical protein